MKIIPIKEACKMYDCSKQWLYRLDTTKSILLKIEGKTFVNIQKFEGLAKSRNDDENRQAA